MGTRTLIVKVVGDEADLLRSFKKSEKAAAQFNAQMTRQGRITKQATAGIGALGLAYTAQTAAVVGLGVAVKASFAELFEGQKVAAQTAAVLESTGGIANVTAKDVDTLAQSLLAVSGIDDELIKRGENLLLTFTSVRNEVGRGNDVFTQATKAALDMSVAMGTDLNSAVLRIGKALNDPIRGITALRRVGVQFTDAQQKQIKALVASGKQLEAQRIILRELQTEFGGSAKAAGDTLPGQLNKARESARNLGATVASSTVPALTNMADALNNLLTAAQNLKNPRKGLPSLRDFFKGFGENVPKGAEALPTVGPFLGALQTAFHKSGEKSADEFLKGFGPKFKKGFTVALSPINTAGAGGIVEFFRKNIRQPGTATPFLDLQKANAVASRSLREQLKVIRQTIAVLSGRLARAGTLKAKTALREEINQLQQEAFGIVQTLNQAKQAAAAARRAAQEAARERKKAQAQAAADARTKAQLALLGLGPTTFKDVQKALGRVSQAVKGTFLDTGKTRSLLAHIRQILKAGIKNVSQEVLDAIKQLLDDIDQQLDKRTGRSRTKFQKQGIDQLVNGLGLTPEQERALRGRLGARGPGGETATGANRSAFGVPVKGGGSINIQTVILHGVQSKSELMRDLQKEGQRRSGSRRGPNAGNSLGFA